MESGRDSARRASWRRSTSRGRLRQSAAGARRPEGIWDAYVRTRGVRVFCEAARGRGVVRMALTKRPYGF